MSDRPVAGRSAAPVSTLPSLHDDAAAHGLAELWYREHLAQHLSHDHVLAAKRCAAFLQGEGVAAPRAARIALQALGRMEYGRGGAYFDLARTTSYTLFMVDPETGREFAITAADLIQHARCNVDRAPHVTAHQPAQPGAPA